MFGCQKVVQTYVNHMYSYVPVFMYAFFESRPVFSVRSLFLAVICRDGPVLVAPPCNDVQCYHDLRIGVWDGHACSTPCSGRVPSETGNRKAFEFDPIGKGTLDSSTH